MPLEFTNLPVRFFKWDDEANGGEGDFAQCSEIEFLDAEGKIEYDRHDVFTHGVAQICLTKNPLTI